MNQSTERPRANEHLRQHLRYLNLPFSAEHFETLATQAAQFRRRSLPC